VTCGGDGWHRPSVVPWPAPGSPSVAGALAPLALVLLLFVAGCHGPVAALYPPRPDEPSLPVWVVEHGWHAGLVVDRRALPQGLWPEQDDFPDASYLEVGWGDAKFYQARDPGVGLALEAALVSSGSALHLVGLPALPSQVFAGREVVEVRLSRPGLDALARFVDDTFAREGLARAPRLGPGLYGPSVSAFYPARGRYHLLNTCNTWIADALRAAGAPITPVYAATAGILMWQVRQLGRRVDARGAGHSSAWAFDRLVARS